MTTVTAATTDEAALLDRVSQAFVSARANAAAPLRVGVAVSGGGDSMALLHLLYRAAAATCLDLRAVTVDHGLRPASGAEALQVAAVCAQLGIAHDTLIWQGPAPVGNLMDQARRARLALIGAWARGHDLSHVALGHTADDQAETFLMNLSRGSGLDGLSGMRPAWTERGIGWTRPLLQTPRADLRAYLRRNGVSWVDDPTNDDAHYLRVRARQALMALAPLGISVEGLNRTVAHLGAARSALCATTQRVALGIEDREGALRMDRAALLSEPRDICRRLLIAMIRWMNGTDYPPRQAKLCQLARALTAGSDATLGGVRFHGHGDTITVVREMRAVMGPVPPAQVWDHRWRLSPPASGLDEAGLTVAALGERGLRQCPDWRATGACRAALIVTPALWAGTTLIAAPLAGQSNGWTATLGPSFQSFVISH